MSAQMAFVEIFLGGGYECSAQVEFACQILKKISRGFPTWALTVVVQFEQILARLWVLRWLLYVKLLENLANASPSAHPQLW